tara:strand:+ start:574 stop:786 length:213 start_codon:yes stop_codon:yes gene_type:complete
MPGTIKMVFSNAKSTSTQQQQQQQQQQQLQSQQNVQPKQTALTSNNIQKSRFNMFDINNIPKGCRTCGTA